MDVTDAVRQVARLKQLFPTMNDEQASVLSDEFEKFDADIVSAAIENHYRTQRQFVNGAALISDIEGRSAQKRCLSRQHDVAAEARRRREAIKAEQRRADASVERNFQTVARLPKGEVDRIRDRLAAKYEKTFPYLARRVREADPTKSPMVAALICQHASGNHGVTNA